MMVQFSEMHKKGNKAHYNTIASLKDVIEVQPKIYTPQSRLKNRWDLHLFSLSFSVQHDYFTC
jgi:hypothetical protein